MKLRSNRKQDEETTYWLSYSDMMAGLLLVFVLIISLTVLHANIRYDQKQEELMGKEQELVIQSKELENERLTVDEQQAVLNAQEARLAEQEGQLAEQRATLEKQENDLRTQSELLRELNAIMESQQEKLDRIIGVRSELIEDLSREFSSSSLQVAVDEQTGAISMDSSILFEYNADELKDGGKEFLSAFLPRYTNILLSDKYSEYISEIIIEGHTDTSGTYLFNLDLSQKRAYSVAEYCMSPSSGILDDARREALQSVLSSSGRSFSSPIYKADGSVDPEASRRVEILFRLKDEEMIREMIDILNNGGSAAAASAGAAGDGTTGPADAGPGGGTAGSSTVTSDRPAA
ncbi:MAG: OmpA family protein [Eubacteriales bacterium]|nr:OmpA family protein [Eubacteriales bacterium]